MKLTTQSIAAVGRQVGAIAGLAVSLISAAEGSHLLPLPIAGVLASVSGALLLVEHFVSDPSTGTPAPPPVPAVKAAPVAQPAAPPAAAPTVTVAPSAAPPANAA